MKRYRILCHIFLLVFLFVCLSECKVYAEELSDKDLYAQAAVLMDAESGRVLFSKNGTKKMANASTTKILTCILVLEEMDLDEIAYVSSYAASQPKVRMGAGVGEAFRIENLLYALMLESYNDAAVILAEHQGGRYLEWAQKESDNSKETSKKMVEAFVNKMNEKAVEIGCNDTSFFTPNGLDVQEEKGFHGTTAQDLARIMAYCVNKSPAKEMFLQITQARQKIFLDESGRKSYTCINHNQLLERLDGIVSGKTGFTNRAGYCYVGAFRDQTRTFVFSLLACGWPNNRSYKWEDSRRLVTYGRTEYEFREFEVAPKISVVHVKNGLAENGNPYQEVFFTPEMVNKEEKIELLCKETEQMECEVICEPELDAPIGKGNPVGVVRCFLITDCGEKILQREYTLIASKAIDERKSIDILRFVLQRFLF